MPSRYLSDKVPAFLHPLPLSPRQMCRCRYDLPAGRVHAQNESFPRLFLASPSGFFIVLQNTLPRAHGACLLFFRSISRMEQSCRWELLSHWVLTAHRLHTSSQLFHHNMTIVCKICKVLEKGVPENTFFLRQSTLWLSLKSQRTILSPAACNLLLPAFAHTFVVW